MEAMGTDKNPIHLLCSAYPEMDPGGIVQMVKSITAWEIFRRKPPAIRVLWGEQFLDRRVPCGDGGERANRQTLERYVQRQGYPVKIYGSSNVLGL